MRDVRRAAAAVTVMAVTLAGCGGGTEPTGGQEADGDGATATRESATAQLCELWEQARDAEDPDAAQAALDAADDYIASLPTTLRQPARGDARMQCGSAEREAKQRIHQARTGG